MVNKFDNVQGPLNLWQHNLFLRTNPCRSATKLAAEAEISQTSMRRILKEDLKTFPYKMQKRHELTATHERIRVERYRPHPHGRWYAAQFGVL